ncbi:MAG: hypothetical protein JTT11_08940, partial [Candidatus Brockarchaeota archaeon]|nr:hypothetical protein [Candidatus Brockarchaeota archaeon]
VLDLECTLFFRVTDPAVLVRNLILDEGKYLEKDVDQKIHEVMEEVVASELSKHRASDLPLLADAIKESLNKEMGNWGMEAAGFTLNSLTQPRDKIRPIAREPAPGAEVQREPIIQVPKAPGVELPKATQHPAEFRSLSKREQQPVAGKGLSTDADWESRAKKWVPLSKRGEVKCDGCANDVDWFAECDQNCRSSGKCKLCKECFAKRNMCAFA